MPRPRHASSLLQRFILGLVLAVGSFVILPPAGHAVEPDEILADPALESRARKISADLRCLVCQNQSIDDSNAPLARDLRLLVRERLKQGDTDTAVRAFVVQRYGEFVLLRPPLSVRTLLLWLAPLLLLALTAAILWSKRRMIADRTTPAALSPEEQARLDQILRDRK